MFRTAELGRKVSKDEFDAIAHPLRIEMIDLQQQLRHADFATVIVFAGVDGAGKNQTINLLNEWMDPRWIVTRAYSAPSDEERERPEFWRYWRDLPPRGTIGLFLRSWYSSPVLDAAYGRINPVGLDSRLDRIVNFETGLAADGTLIVKFWLHLSRAAQKRRLKTLAKDPHESWRLSETDWRHYKMYDQFVTAAERTILRTSTAQAPWTLVEGEDAHYRELTVLTTVRDAALRHLEHRRLRRQALDAARARANASNGGGNGHPPAAAADTAAADPGTAAPLTPDTLTPDTLSPDTELAGTGTADLAPADPEAAEAGFAETVRVAPPQKLSVLGALDMSRGASKPAYDRDMPRLTARLHNLYRKAKERGISSVLVFEGWDAAGKGGTIRRITAGLDARDYQVIPIAAPTDEERVRHYLWRFWRHMTRSGRVLIFDRSWYGRVLVERVENLAAEEEWRRAYAEINNFEQHLIDHGIILVKYWLHITQEEQFARFERRAKIPYKRWKLTEEDWRNRDKWDAYEFAVTDMIEKTSTHIAPWTLIEGNCKRHARLKAVETFCAALEAKLKQNGKEQNGKEQNGKGKKDKDG